MSGESLVMLYLLYSDNHSNPKVSEVIDVEWLRSALHPGVSLQDAIEILLGNQDGPNFDNISGPVDVCVEPPDPDSQSPQDSGNEDDEEGDIGHLPGKQLLAPAVIIYRYNHGKGGTDLMDQNVNAYRIGIRNKKWWWAIFSWVIDVSIQNAWILSRKGSNRLTQLQFRRELAQVYLTRYAVARKHPGPTGRYISTSRVLDDIRFDREDHLVCYTEEKKMCWNGLPVKSKHQMQQM